MLHFAQTYAKFLVFFTNLFKYFILHVKVNIPINRDKEKK